MVPAAFWKNRLRPTVCAACMGSSCRLPSVTPRATAGPVKWARRRPPVSRPSVSFSWYIVSAPDNCTRDKLSAEQLGALRELGVEWA